MLGALFLVPVLNNLSFYNIRGTNSNLKYIKGANMPCDTSGNSWEKHKTVLSRQFFRQIQNKRLFILEF